MVNERQSASATRTYFVRQNVLGHYSTRRHRSNYGCVRCVRTSRHSHYLDVATLHRVAGKRQQEAVLTRFAQSVTRAVVGTPWRW